MAAATSSQLTQSADTVSTPPLPSDLHSQRRQYDAGQLLEAQCPSEPFALFERWLSQALEQGILDATAMTVSTVNSHGQPSSRVVLLKQWDPSGFVFYTGHDSRKGRDLADNPLASLLLHWRETSRQVHIEAVVERLGPALGETYFAQRPRDSQLATRAAIPAGTIASRQDLEARFEAEAQLWRNKAVAMPTQWGGYRAVPRRIEFWQGRTSRLHDRVVYERQSASQWSRFRLTP